MIIMIVPLDNMYMNLMKMFDSRRTKTIEGSCGSQEESSHAMSNKERIECIVIKSNKTNKKSKTKLA